LNNNKKREIKQNKNKLIALLYSKKQLLELIQILLADIKLEILYLFQITIIHKDFKMYTSPI